MADIMDLTKICYTFPEIKEPNIPRDNFLNSIEEVYKKNINIVILKGDDEIGKTTMLAQFAKKYFFQTISVFVNPASYWGCDEQLIIKDFCNQIHFLLEQKELSDTEEINDSLLRHLIYKLGKYSRNMNKIYFVVDGLEDIPEEAEEKRKNIFNLFPLENQNFYFLFSGEKRIITYIEERKKNKFEIFNLLPFTIGEAEIYLQDLEFEAEITREIYKITKGHPGHLASVRRLLLKPDVNKVNLLEEILNNNTEFLEMEWKNVNYDDEKLLKLIALIAHETKRHFKEDIIKLLDIDEKTLTQMLSNLYFLEYDIEKEEIFFVSETYRKFAAQKLSNLKDTINDMKIKYWSENINNKEALNCLPVYLQQSKNPINYERLLNYLSLENFTKILEFNKSLYPLKEKVKMGLNTSLELKKINEIIKFSIYNSVLVETDRIRTQRAEIRARTILDGYDSAIKLAQNSLLKEDRLHLLAIIARLKQEEGLTLEEQLSEEIRNLYEQIDTVNLEERYIDIASDLIYSHVDLALDLIEKVTNSKADPNALDLTYVKLVMTAMSLKQDDINSSDFIDSVRNKIKDPGLKNFSSHIKLLFDDYNEKEIINQIKKLINPSEKMFLLRLWLVTNREKANAFEVIEYALNVFLTSGAYAPKVTDLCDMSMPLPFIKDSNKLKKLINEFDIQKEYFKNIGPAEDYVKWQLILSNTELEHDFDVAYKRLFELFKYIDSLEDMSVKTPSLAQMTSEFANIAIKLTKKGNIPVDKINRIKNDLEKLKNQLKTYIDDLLSNTANHYEITKNIIKALSEYLPNMALELALKLNTEDRRERALFELINYCLNIPAKNINLTFIIMVINKIIDFDIREQALFKVIKRLGTTSVDLEHLVEDALPLIFLIPKTKGGADKCIAFCHGHNFLKKYNKNNKFDNKFPGIISELNTAWETIDEEWVKVDIGFRIAYLLSKYNREQGNEYLKKANDLKNKILLPINTCANVYMACINLALQAYKGLLSQKLVTENEFDCLDKFIGNILSESRKAELWSDIALYHYLNNDKSKCEEIVCRKVKPLIEQIKDEKCKIYTVTKVAPALFHAHSLTAYDIISELPRPDKELAYVEICNFIIRKKLSSEPYDILHNYSYNLTYENITDLCDILKKIETDNLIYYFIELIADHASKKDTLTRPQKNKIISLLQELIKEKFPDAKNIKHEGYIITTKIQMARISDSGSSQVWSDLKNDIDKIPNLSDKIFVLTKRALAMFPSVSQEQKKVVFEEIEKLINTVPSLYEKLVLYEIIAHMANFKDKNLAKKFMALAIEVSNNEESPELYKIQRKIIDSAYNLDEKFAESLTAMINNDPARIKTAKLLKKEMEILELKKRIRDQKILDISQIETNTDYPYITWKLLGSLNADRISARKFNEVYDNFKIAAVYPMRKAYPLLSWTIENIVVKYSKTPQADEYLKPIFKAMLSGAELTSRLFAKKAIFPALSQSPNSNEKGCMIEIGERDKAFEILKDWLESKASDYIKICDAYFGPEELEIIKILNTIDKNFKVKILTSKKHQQQKKLSEPYNENYRIYWESISDQTPPETQIFIVGTRSGGKSPIHDRWILSRGCGLDIGTSLNSLGRTQASKIKPFTEQEAEYFEKISDNYFSNSINKHGEEFLDYQTFYL